MKVPSPHFYRHWLPSFGVFLCGMVVGAAVFMSIYHRNYNELYMQNFSLEEQANSLALEVKSLEQYKNQPKVIKSLKVYLVTDKEKPLDLITAKDIKHKVEKDLTVFIGQPIMDVPEDAREARRFMSKKIYPSVKDRDYTVELETVVVKNSELHIWVTVKQFKREIDSSGQIR